MIEVDAAIIGSGPAGAVAALNLAPFRRVLIIERRADLDRRWRIGESLPPAARRLLSDMGLWNAFQSDGHAPCWVHRSQWGSAEAVERNLLSDPDGHGWHLDRARFDAMLRRVASARGANFLMPARPIAIQRRGDEWDLQILYRDRSIPVRARLLIDAGGRRSNLMREFGGHRRTHDRLICSWISGQASDYSHESGRGVTYVEAELAGWWYSSVLPNGNRIIAFYTDSDLPEATEGRTAEQLLARAARLVGIPTLIPEARFITEHGICTACSSELVPPAGESWLAVGDAALSFDPLSSQGLFNALHTGLAAAETADRYLDDEADALSAYSAMLAPIRDSYRANLAAWYGEERRWLDKPFWQRRVSIRRLPRSKPWPENIAYRSSFL